jgi:hypothetical protein
LGRFWEVCNDVHRRPRSLAGWQVPSRDFTTYVSQQSPRRFHRCTKLRLVRRSARLNEERKRQGKRPKMVWRGERREVPIADIAAVSLIDGKGRQLERPNNETSRKCTLICFCHLFRLSDSNHDRPSIQHDRNEQNDTGRGHQI